MNFLFRNIFIFFVASQTFGQEQQFNLQRSLPLEANAAFAGSGGANRLVIGTHYQPFVKNYFSLSNYVGYDQYVKKLHGGLGIDLNQTIYKTYNNYSLNRVMVNYAFHQKITEKLKLSLGVGAGFARSSQHFEFTDTSGLVVSDTTFYNMSFRYKAGVILHSKNFYIGAQYIPSTKLITSPYQQYFQLFKLYAGGQLSPFNNKELTFSPSVLFSSQSGYQLLDLQLAFATPKFAVGINTTVNRKIGGFAGVYFNKFNLKYHYAINMSSLSSAHRQSHELVFNIQLNASSSTNPAFFGPKLF